jgi:hypothetical protein
MPDNTPTTTESEITVTQNIEREFVAWPKIPRFNRETIITEKIDGTNACIVITSDDIYAQSRKQIITTERDNHGFATWVAANAEELREQLGEGRHFGEWWGAGIGKRYSAQMRDQPKRFSLFNAIRWNGSASDGFRCYEAPLCHVVPVLGIADRLDTSAVDHAIERLRKDGSYACPGATSEGVIVYHPKGNVGFKITLEKDAEWKGNDRVA